MEILIADDQRATLTVMKSVLTHSGYTVTLAVDGEEAVAAASRQNFVAIVTDMQMPKLTGLEVIRTLRGRGDLTPIIVCSADRDKNVIHECISAGAAEFMQKPIDHDRLLVLLSQFIARR